MREDYTRAPIERVFGELLIVIKNIKISALNRTEYDENDACWGKQIIIASFHTQNLIAVVSKSNFSVHFSWERCAKTTACPPLTRKGVKVVIVTPALRFFLGIQGY